MNILCIASYFKGEDFLREARRQGAHVLLVTSQGLEDKEWPRESIDQMFFMTHENGEWDIDDLILSVSYLARSQHVDRIVALDDFDVEKAAALREHLRVPGMGQTTARYFRDKLAMRMQADEAGIPVPRFAHVLNHQAIDHYLKTVTGPWVIKPRSEAGAIGIRKVHTADEAWDHINGLGDRQSFHLIEAFVPGTIYHVDSVVAHGKVRFARCHEYHRPLLDVAHAGGIFCSQSVKYGSSEEETLLGLNDGVLSAMGHRSGISHTEFMRDERDGTFYFLETSARVGGANIAEMVEASTGLNLWAEWARIECLSGGEDYRLPDVKDLYGGIVISLARDEQPDTSGFTDQEIAWRLSKPYHIGFVVTSPSHERIETLLDSYTERIQRDFHASAPMGDRPPP
jgi:biotin carboxylase